MALLNYNNRLQNLQNRKFDRELNESLLSKSFSSTALPDDIKYLVESMRPIDTRYNERTLEAADRVKKHLENGFQLHFNRAYRTQGSVKTGTNIKVHSDFDLLTVIDRYFFPEVSNENVYTVSDPNDDIKELRKQATEILNGIYDEVDDKNEKCVSIFNKSLNRKVDVVFGFWYNSTLYEEKGEQEYYRGIYLYKFPNGPKTGPDYPFAHIAQVNYKGDNTNDGSRKGIRLLKTLRADCETKLEVLKSFQLTTIVHNVENSKLNYTIGNELNIATAISEEMGKIINDPAYRKQIKSPNGVEYPLTKDEIVSEIKVLKQDLDNLIIDATNDIFSNTQLKKALITY